MTQRPVNLMGAYLMTFLGAALGISLQVYLTLNVPDFLDAVRITTSLVRGLIIGSIFGLGIFLTRIITERLHISNTILSLFLGTIVGGIVMNIALFMFHILYLGTFPQGFLITLGCMLIAITFAVGNLIHPLLKMFFSSISILMAIMGTWLIHVNLAASPVEFAPMFRYDYFWPLSQVLLTALGVAFLIGIFGNIFNLSLRNEHP